MASTPKASSSKRANPPRLSDYTKEFTKDWHRLTRSGRYNMQQLKEVMMLLIANEGWRRTSGAITSCSTTGPTTANAMSVATSC
jgi:hypothetical protein